MVQGFRVWGDYGLRLGVPRAKAENLYTRLCPVRLEEFHPRASQSV